MTAHGPKPKSRNIHFISLFSEGQSKEKILRYIIGIIAIIVFLIAWDVYAQINDSEYLPRPFFVFKALYHSFLKKDITGYTMGEHIIASLTRIISGFALAFALAVPLGLVMGWSKYVHSAGSPLIELIRPIPPIAWIPFAIVFFNSPFDTTFIVFLGVFFPVLLNTIFGVKHIDPIIIDAAKTFGVTRRNILQKVIFPAVIPTIMTGIRIGLGIGWMCIVAAELVGVEGGGVGFYIQAYASLGRFNEVFAGMIVIGFLGFTTVGTSSYIERRVSKWMGMR